MEGEVGGVAAPKIILSVLVGGFLVLFYYLCELVVFRPKRLRSKLQKQGFRGPPPSFLLGNLPAIKSMIKIKSQNPTATETVNRDGVDVAASISHEWPSKVFPYIEPWTKEYGPTFMFAAAHVQILYVTDVELLKEIRLCKSLSLGNTTGISRVLGPLLGKGLISSNGSSWAHQRKVIAPELYLDKVKGMVNIMVESTTLMLRTWESEIESHGGIAEIRVNEHLSNLSADIISRACFKRNYRQGEEIFLKLRALRDLLCKELITGTSLGLRLLPTKDNREIWRLEKEINSMILKVVKQRVEAAYEKDLLQMILEGAKNSADNSALLHKNFIVDNCKTLFFAGHETTALATSWALTLLAAHPDWQARARAEVLEICRDKPLDADMLRSMKVLKMVIHEVLRLYPIGPFAAREAFETITLKNIVIPKGCVLQIPIAYLHQNPDIWGPDAHKFNPERFSNGILKACQPPQAYMPFGMGANICVGQHLAMTELKVILAFSLSKFSFSLSPAYQHSPVYNLATAPEHGILLHVKRVNS